MNKISASIMKVYMLRKDKGGVCNNILRALPKWFADENAIHNYVKGVEKLPAFVCKIDNETVGFLAIKIHNAYTAEIYVMGVIPKFQRQGIGNKLLKKAETYLQDKKIEFLTVKTLSAADSYKPYKKTRLFYTSYGFKPIEDFGSLIWGKDNPCLLMLKKI